MQSIPGGSESEILNKSSANLVPEEHIEKIGNSILKQSEVYTSVAFNWDLETVRSLVLTNLTGITAVGALAASKINISSNTLYLSFVMYGFGICFGILDMHLATLLYQWRARHSVDVLVEFINKKTFPALIDMQGKINAKPPWKYRFVSCFGWVSGALFIIGTIIVVISLIRNTR